MLVKLFTSDPARVKNLSGPVSARGIASARLSPEEMTVKHVISTLANVGGRGKVLPAPFSVVACRLRHRGVTAVAPP
jgi:hypothetical protein